MHYNDVERTVNDIPDEELLRRAVSGAAIAALADILRQHLEDLK